MVGIVSFSPIDGLVQRVEAVLKCQQDPLFFGLPIGDRRLQSIQISLQVDDPALVHQLGPFLRAVVAHQVGKRHAQSDKESGEQPALFHEQIDLVLDRRRIGSGHLQRTGILTGSPQAIDLQVQALAAGRRDAQQAVGQQLSVFIEEFDPSKVRLQPAVVIAFQGQPGQLWWIEGSPLPQRVLDQHPETPAGGCFQAEHLYAQFAARTLHSKHPLLLFAAVGPADRTAIQPRPHQSRLEDHLERTLSVPAGRLVAWFAVDRPLDRKGLLPVALESRDRDLQSCRRGVGHRQRKGITEIGRGRNDLLELVFVVVEGLEGYLAVQEGAKAEQARKQAKKPVRGGIHKAWFF